MATQSQAIERLFQALGDATRLRILGLLLTGEVCVCDIHESLKISQPKASRHLAYLRRAGLVAARREGLWMYYRLAESREPLVDTDSTGRHPTPSRTSNASRRDAEPPAEEDRLLPASDRRLSQFGVLQPGATQMNEAGQGLRSVPATAADAGAILSLLERSKLPTDGLIDHLHQTIVARRLDEIVGSVALEVYAGGALLRSLAVDSGERGARLGHRLTEAAIARATELGTPALYLLTTTAERFFPRFGFQQIDRTDVPASVQDSVEFKSACPASAIVMRRLL